MYLAVLWICDRVFDADSGNGFHIPQKQSKAEYKNSGHPTKRYLDLKSC